MSDEMTPTNSVAPSAPVPSNNPNLILGAVTSFVNWFKRYSSWIAGLSPDGATVYDTGTITSGLSFTLTNFSNLSYKVIRRGMTALIRVDGTYTGPTITVGSSGNVLDQELFILPPGWRPIDVTYDGYLGDPALSRMGPKIEPNGVVSLVDGPPGLVIESGSPMRLNVRIELP